MLDILLAIEPPPIDMNPAKTYIAKAVPTSPPHGFYAQYAWPGVAPLYVTDEKVPIIFDEEHAAQLAASNALLQALNNRPGMPGAKATKRLRPGTVVKGTVRTVGGETLAEGTVVDRSVAIETGRVISGRDKPERYQRLTGAEFSILLAEAGITPTFFAYLYNTNMQRIVGWMDAVEDNDLAPHPVRVLLEVFKAYPETIDVAEAVTNAVTTARRGERS